jgi:hypothetical protein
VIRPVVLYACERWIEKTKLEVWKRKVQKKIFGGEKMGEVWRRRRNEEIKQLYHLRNITEVVKTQRFRWPGHVERMDEERVPEMLEQAGERQKVGRGSDGK